MNRANEMRRTRVARSAGLWALSSAVSLLVACSSSDSSTPGADGGSRQDAASPGDAESRGDGPASDAARTDGAAGDAGIPDAMRCATPADCGGVARPSVNLCGASRYSCIARSCVWDCMGGQRCDSSAQAGCIDCLGPGMICASSACFPDRQTIGRIEDTTCSGSLLAGGASIVIEPLSNCEFQLSILGSGLVLGRYDQLSDGSYFASFPALGGLCRGIQAATGAVRILWSCPACQFVEGL